MRLLQAIRRRLAGRSIENPATTLGYPDEWLTELAGGASSTGLRVSKQSAMTYSPVWRSINVISRDVGRLPLNVYRREGGGKDKAITHPAYWLLRRKPHANMTDYTFKQGMTGCALMLGNAYALIERGGDGRPMGLMVIASEKVTPVVQGGKLSYLVEFGPGDDRRVLARDMFHLRGFTDDGLVGISVVDKFKESIGLGLAGQRFQAVQFKNGGRPAVVLEYPGVATEDMQKRLRISWDRLYTGLENTGRTAVLEGGMKANTLSMSNHDSQLLQLREHQIRDAANWFGVPAHKLGDTTRTSFSSLEQENQSYLDTALDPWLSGWEAECWDKLLTEPQKRGDTHVVEFNREAIVQADFDRKVAGLRSLVDGGIMSPDESRSRLNLNPQPGGLGEVYFRPLNMGVAGDTPAPPPDPPGDPPDPPARSLGPAFLELARDALARALRQVTTKAQRAAKDPDGFIDWIDDQLQQKNRQYLTGLLVPVARVLADQTGRELDMEELTVRFFSMAQDWLMEATSATPDKLPDAVRAAIGRLDKQLPGLLAQWIIDEVTHHED